LLCWLGARARTTACAQLAKVEVEDEDTAADILDEKWFTMLMYAISFFLVFSQFTDTVRLTHRAPIMRRRAMVPFVLFLFGTSLFPISFILGTSFDQDLNALLFYIGLVALARMSLMFLRCSLFGVMEEEHPLQNALETSISMGHVLGCAVVAITGVVFSAAGVRLSTAWSVMPIALSLSIAVCVRGLACCYPEDMAAARAYNNKYGRWKKDQNRIAAFTDGVFSIAATFTLLEIRAPPLGSQGSFSEFLSSHAADLLSYTISAAVIFQMWVTHREVLSTIPRLGRVLTVLNALACLIVGLIPFGMSLLVNFREDSTASMFASTVVLGSSSSIAMMPICARWWLRGPSGYPLSMIDVDEEEGGEEEEATGGRPAPSTDTYFPFLVEENPASDGKGRVRMFPSGAKALCDDDEDRLATMGNDSDSSRPAESLNESLLPSSRVHPDRDTAVIVATASRGGYSACDLPAPLEEHLLRLMVARALVLPMLSAVALLVSQYLAGWALLTLFLAWPINSLIGWADHSLRDPAQEPWAITRILLCWTGRGNAIAGIGRLYPMAQGPCCCFSKLRSCRSRVMCDRKMDMDSEKNRLKFYSVATLARDSYLTSGKIPSRRKVSADDSVVAVVSRAGDREGLQTELTSSSIRGASPK
jgi:uncharacterized membrane protein